MGAALIHAAVPRQGGAVLLLTLLLLVALMLGAGGLMRMVEQSNHLAGNLAFKRAAVLAAENGAEAAIAWLEAQSATVLASDNASAGYYAATTAPLNASGVTGDTTAAAADWRSDQCAGITAASCLKTAALAGTDAAGHSVRYLVQRLCNATGAHTPTGECALHIESEMESSSRGGLSYGSNKRLGGQPLAFYRITARAVGPRDTVGLVQVLVRL